MLRINRTIDVDGQAIKIWLGLDSKRDGLFTVYLLTDNPDNSFNHAEKLVGGIEGKNEAIRQGITFAKKIFRNILKNREQESL